MTAEDLRKSILQQAIQGKLVPQDPNDEPASELLSKIRAEKERLIKEKKIKRDKNETIIYRGEDNSYYEKILATGEVKCIDDEIPFDIPDSWEWCRLGNVINLLSGRDLQPNEYNSKGNGIPYMTGASNFEYGKLIINRWTMKPVTISSLGDILITCKGTIGEIAINNIGEIHIARQIMAISSKIVHMPYLKIYIASLISMLKAKAKSIIPGISRDNLLNALISIPPIYEQQKIAKKYSVIQPYIEAYNVAEMQTKEIETNILQNLCYSILQYAIQGRLVKQEERDGTAFALLEQIQKEKAELVAEGKLKKSELKTSVIFRGDDNKYYEKIGKSIVDITDTIPFDIPDSWLWCRLSSVADLYTGNSINETEKKNKYTNVEGVKYIATKDVQFDHSIIYDNGIAIPKQYVSEFRIAPANSVLMCIEGGSAGRKIGILSHDVCFGNKLCCFKPYADISEYIYYYLQSPLFYSIFSSNKNGIIGGVSVNNLKQLLIPMPTLSEIKRIVNILRKSISIIES